MRGAETVKRVVLTMSGIVGAHLAAELNVPPVALSRAPGSPPR